MPACAPSGPRPEGLDEAAEVFAALLESAVLVERGARGRQEDDAAGTGFDPRRLDGLLEGRDLRRRDDRPDLRRDDVARLAHEHEVRHALADERNEPREIAPFVLAAENEHDPSRKALQRSEEHTSELQSLAYLVCRLL